MITSIPPRPRAAGSDFAVLNRQITDAGLLERRPAYYAVRMSVVAAMLVAVGIAFLAVGSSWWTLLVAAFLGVAFSQAALLAHDVAHRQVFRTRKLSDVVGRIAGNLVVGMSYGWWTEKHTRHHNNPNHDELDPDVQPEVLIWATESAWGRRGLKGFIARHQAGLFFPLLTLLSLDLRISSFKALRRPGMPYPSGDEDYLRKQVLTSRNVSGGPLTDAALGGLNYQIEHHLFPAMPTPNLRRAQPLVKAYCRRIGIPYEETSLLESYRQALRHLHAVGAPLRAARTEPNGRTPAGHR